MGGWEVTEYEIPEISCKDGGAHKIKYCMTRPSYCVYCKRTDEELFGDRKSSSYNYGGPIKEGAKEASLDDFMD